MATDTGRSSIKNYAMTKCEGEPLIAADIIAHWFLPRLKAWWAISPSFWSWTVAGYGIVLASIATSFEVPSSGAVLICTAILSELQLLKLSWKGSINQNCSNNTNYQIYRSTDPNSCGYSYAAWNQKEPFGVPIWHATDFHLVANLSKRPHFQGASEGNVLCFSKTVGYIEKVLNWWVTTALIVGTLLTGYGHLITWPDPSYVSQSLGWFKNIYCSIR